MRITGDADVLALVDRMHLEQIVANLLTNTGKYGGGSAEVRVEQEGDRVVLVVADAGPGVPASLVPTMFDRFTQGDSGDRRSSSGVGLGLSIVRDLVEANDGTITYLGLPGTGAVFEVRLPGVGTPSGGAVVADVDVTRAV